MSGAESPEEGSRSSETLVNFHIDSISGVVENKESRLGACLDAREDALREIKGPSETPLLADLCFIHKRFFLATDKTEAAKGTAASVGGTGDEAEILDFRKVARSERQSTVGYYHYLVGLDTSHAASIAAYVNRLYQQQHPGDDVLGCWKMQRVLYCAYDAFSQLDVRVQITFPGTVVSYVVDSRGNYYHTNEQVWQEVHLSSVLRSMHPHKDLTKFPALRVLTPLSSQAREQTFLNRLAEQLLELGSRLGVADTSVVPTVARNNLVDKLVRYFFDARRFEAAITFFSQFVHEESGLIVPVALAHFELGQSDVAIGLLLKNLHSPLSAADLPCLMALAEVYRRQERSDVAVELASTVVEIAPWMSEAWLLLARCYVMAKQYDMAVIACNGVPYCTDEDDVLGAHYTQYHTVPVGMSRVARDMFYDNIYVEFADHWYRDMSYNSLNTLEAKVYAVLADIMSHVGWSELLAIRSRVFILDGGEEEGGEAAATTDTDEEGGGTPNNASTSTSRVAQGVDATVEDAVLSPRVTSQRRRVTNPDLAGAGAGASSSSSSSASAMEDGDQPMQDSPMGLKRTMQGRAGVHEASASMLLGGDDGESDATTTTTNTNTNTTTTTTSSTSSSTTTSTTSDHEGGSTHDRRGVAKEHDHRHQGLEDELSSSDEDDEDDEVSDMVRNVRSRMAAMREITRRIKAESLESGGVELGEIRRGKRHARTTGIGSLELDDRAHMIQGSSSSRLTTPKSTGSNHEDMDRPGGKRLCVQWLDGVFHVLHEDVSMLLSRLHAVDEEEHNGLEWLRIGDLARRLQRLESAERCYRMGVDSEEFNTQTWLRLLDMFADQGSIRDSLVATAHLLQRFLRKRFFIGDGMRGLVMHQVFVSLAKLLAKTGAEAVGEVLQDEEFLGTRAALQTMVNDLMRWGVKAGLDD